MFDFIKNIRSKKSLKDGKQNLVKGVSYVADNELEEEINNFFRFSMVDYKSFGLVLLKLGFDQDKKLYLKRTEDKDILEFYYRYEDEEDSNQKIELYKKIKNNSIYYQEEYCISLINGDFSTIYNITLNSQEDGNFKLEKNSECIKKNINGIEYLRDVRKEELYINIKWENGIEFSLICRGDFNFNVNNELGQYLINITPSISVFEIYKKICEIGLNDENKFFSVDFCFKNGKENLSNLRYYPRGTYNTLFPKETFVIKEKGRDVAYYRHLYKYHLMLYEDDNYSDKVKIEVVNGDYQFNLLVKPIISMVSLSSVKLDNEIGLRDYFLNLEFPVRIEDVYKKICEISLGDISRYSLIELNICYKDDSIEKLILNDGNFKYYKIVRDEKEIEIDDEGTFVYKVNSKDRSLSVDMVGNRIKKYEFISEEGLNVETDNGLENPLQSIISDVKEERVKTRKLIDKIIK